MTTVNISDDDKYIISGSTDRSVKLWMVDDEEVRDENCHQLGDNQIIYNTVKFSSDNHIILAGGKERTEQGDERGLIKLWKWREENSSVVSAPRTSSLKPNLNLNSSVLSHSLGEQLNGNYFEF